MLEVTRKEAQGRHPVALTDRKIRVAMIAHLVVYNGDPDEMQELAHKFSIFAKAWAIERPSAEQQ
ncbi:hypothetical protein [Methylobacterium trifolii]|uniref:Uncharacterized protein n=1 Tax=Methylobacterium trifolii TaxID=1003092 RepID=A0ABQ4U1I6_9HYPH|nr:hypothetical protein [Methylobacterium trifolii]GJE61330.1 hypothetical protein MPOCJGCO_3452 [Methylobacterium trifolii]